MNQTKAIFWLGSLERRQFRHISAAASHRAKLAEGPALRPVPPENGLPPLEQSLINEVLHLFDDTLDQFDRQKDRDTRAIIDHLALAVVSCIRQYVEVKANG